MNYSEIKSKQPTFRECFFAFSQKQFDEAVKKHGMTEKKIINGGHGLYGTKEGIDELVQFLDNNTKEISENCDPQDVYDYEFANHECDYVCDDEDAIKIVVGYFGAERAKEVKRKHAHIPIPTKVKN